MTQRETGSSPGEPGTEPVAALGADGTATLRAAAIMPDGCPTWLLRQQTGLTGAELGDAIDDLVGRGLLVEAADGVVARDDARESVLGRTPRATLGFLHEHAAWALLDADPTQACRHSLLAAGITGRIDADLVDRIWQAPSVDPAALAGLLLSARTRPECRGDVERVRRWLLAAVDHLALAGRHQEAVQLVTAELGADRSDGRQRALLLGRLAALYATERPSAALDSLTQAMTHATAESGHRATLLAMAAYVAATVGHPQTGAYLRRAGGCAPASGGTARLHLVLARSASAMSLGDVPAARELLASVDPGLPRNRHLAATIRAERIAAHLASGRYDEAAAAISAAGAEVGTLGEAAAPTLLALDCLRLLSVGDLPEAAARSRAAVEGGADPMTTEARAALLGTLIEVDHRSHDGPDHLPPGQELPRCGWPDSMPWMLTFAATAAHQGHQRHAEALRTALGGLGYSRRHLLVAPQNGPRLVRAALAEGDIAGAQQATSATASIARRSPVPLHAAIAHYTTGLLNHEAAALRQAVSMLRTTMNRPLLADALLDLARTPRVPRGEARDSCQEAAARFGRSGAFADQRRAQAVESSLGPGNRPSRPPYGLPALTSAEARVAGLLAAGATKRQAAASLFVSYHTVDAQLRSIYLKLGIRTRLQLVRVLDSAGSRGA